MRWPPPAAFFLAAAFVVAISVPWHLVAPKARAVPPIEAVYVPPTQPAPPKPIANDISTADAHDLMVLWWTAREEADMVLAAFAEPAAAGHSRARKRRASEAQIKADCYDDFMRLCGFSVAMEGRDAAIRCMRDSRADTGPLCKRHLW